VSDILEIRKRMLRFPALPPLCQHILAHTNDPNVDFKKLATTIKHDPGMTTNVLKLANSAYFGMSRKVKSLQTAISILGMKRLFELVVTGSVARTLVIKLPGYNLVADELLKHSVWVAVASEEMAKTLNLAPPDMLFTAGLLHDIGKIVLDELVQKKWSKMESVMDKDEPFDKAEKKTLGMSHADVGAELLDQWHFPPQLVATLRWHHQPEDAPEHKALVQMVHIADILAYSEGIGTGVDGMKYKIDKMAIADLKLKSKILEQVASRTLEEMNELEKILTGKT
jgi:putative nucleotidyltransferase with HDIG domain